MEFEKSGVDYLIGLWYNFYLDNVTPQDDLLSEYDLTKLRG